MYLLKKYIYIVQNQFMLAWYKFILEAQEKRTAEFLCNLEKQNQPQHHLKNPKSLKSTSMVCTSVVGKFANLKNTERGFQ